MATRPTDVTFRIFEGLAPEDVSAFLSLGNKQTYSDGTRLFEELTEAKTLYLVIEGCIELRFEMPGKRQHEGTVITREEKGAAIGWSVFVPPYAYTLSGYCRGDTVVFEIPKERFGALFEKNFHVAYIIMRNVATVIGERLHRMEDALAKCLGEEIMSEG